MEKIGVFYGSSTGNTENVAMTLGKKLKADLFNVSSKPIQAVAEYQNLILGTSTWGLGDLQDDWDAFLPLLLKADLTGKTIALFGLGDSNSYPDSFVEGMGILYEAIKDKGCKIIGHVDARQYNYDSSKAVFDGKFIGLPLDEDNESDLTQSRLDKWVEEIKNDLR
jgi:flavodoxin I